MKVRTKDQCSRQQPLNTGHVHANMETIKPDEFIIQKLNDTIMEHSQIESKRSGGVLWPRASTMGQGVSPIPA